jgi:protoporphyrinogen oxidase
METDILIIGAGLAGLSAAYHLRGRDHMIVEAESQVGGLCKSFSVDGFTFDCTGHLIHFRTEEGKKFIQNILGNKIRQHQRKAAIFLQDRYTDYPFQANTYGLSPEIVKECLLGFVRTLTGKRKRRLTNFHDWIYETFGEGIANHFMVPYNRKLWQHDLRDIALDWVNWSIPKPDLEDVLNGALGLKNKQFGYNPIFYYPVEGGIGSFPRSIPVNGNLVLNNGVEKVDVKARRVTLSDGRQVRYRHLFSTMPLHALLGKLDNVPSFINSARSKLEYVSVLNINIGVEREEVLPFHWVYFPEEDKPFYRVGCPSNFSDTVSPKGTSLLFVEISLRPGSGYDIPEITTQTIHALKRISILREGDRLAMVQPVLLPYAYVIYNCARSKTVKRVQDYLNRNSIYSFGRYGSWVYSSMEDAVLEGKAAAAKVHTI